MNSSRGKNQRQESSLSQRSLEQEKSTLTPYDDRVIPTLRHGNRSRIDRDNPQPLPAINQNGNIAEEELNNPNETGSSEAIVPEQNPFENVEQEMYDPMDGTEEMTEREVREAALMNDYLGKQIVIPYLLIKYFGIKFFLRKCDLS